jgi:hypothetical protein
MEQFWLGCLSVVVILFFIATVVGMVFVVKIWKKLTDCDLMFDDLWRQMDRKEEEIRKDLNLRIDSEIKEIESIMDSRLDKFENKLKISK